ncbi:hypothetical protein Abraxas_093 [Acinetobacter phage Abraxas]|uniref:Uncharacterized protein n=1 Tax=Acinetobacter phage Abraxas TaxID=2736222 RepID=A0A6M9Z5X0_9CAUD|nr:hypothetical protein Abraxas_093 [Acinetobacter phage Abraxas]
MYGQNRVISSSTGEHWIEYYPFIATVLRGRCNITIDAQFVPKMLRHPQGKEVLEFINSEIAARSRALLGKSENSQFNYGVLDLMHSVYQECRAKFVDFDAEVSR